MVVNRNMPGIRKLSNGEFLSIATGIWIRLPVGSDMSIAPPYIAVNALNSNRISADMRKACFILYAKYCKTHAAILTKIT